MLRWRGQVVELLRGILAEQRSTNTELEALRMAILGQTVTLGEKLGAILEKETLMSQQFDDVEALVTALNDATNDAAQKVQSVSDRIDRLIAGMPIGGLSEDQTNQLKQQLQDLRTAQQPIQARLEELGKDPAQPIPPA